MRVAVALRAGLCLASLLAASCGDARMLKKIPAVATPARPTFFIKGVFQQPTFLMSTWASRGVNTLFQMPQGTDINAWTSAAQAAGLKMVRIPRGVDPTSYAVTNPAALAADAKTSGLIGWALPDEPSDIKDGSGIIGYGHGSFDPGPIAGMASRWKGLGQRIWLNELGNHVLNVPSTAYMQDFVNDGVIDDFAADSYQISDGRALVADYAGDNTFGTDQGHEIDRVRAWTLNSNPQMVFIETVQQFGDHGGQISAAQFNAVAWSAIIHGAYGLAYFPIVLTPTFSFDSTPASILTAMSSLHSAISSIETSVLMDTTNGGRRPFVVLPSALSTAGSPLPGQLPYPFEAAQITAANGQTYTICLNLSSSAATLTYAPFGITNAQFSGYQVKQSYNTTDFALVAPANTAAPVVSGTGGVGNALSTTNGTFSGSSPTYTYQWTRGGATISGATSATYTQVQADYGKDIGCIVTATNGAGAASAASNTIFGAGYNPATAFGSALVAWFDPDRSSSIVTSSGKVTSWTDRVGGLVATPPNTNLSPSYSATGFASSIPAITFASGNVLTYTLPSALAAAVTVAQTFSPVSNNGSTQTPAFMGTLGTGTGLGTGYANNGGPGFTSFVYGGGSANKTSGVLAAIQVVSVGSGTLTDTVNGGTSATATSQTLNLGTAASIGAATGSAAFPYVGPVRDQIILNRAPTTAERQSLEGFEACKSGLQSSLASGHSYASTCP